MRAFIWVKNILKAAVFICVLLIICHAFTVISEKNDEESMQLLKSSIERAVTDCYAIEGMYPPDFQYLEDNYGIKIDKEKYYVDYQIFGSNIRPVIQLLETGHRIEGAGFYD